jgi:ferritin-like metal-binding protein YciE
MAELNARDTKLVQYLNEAYGTEKRLETSLEAHIQMTTRPQYKKRLQQHLQETKGHARAVERRIKQLGGEPETVSMPGPAVVTEAATRVQEVAHRGAALAQGPMHAVRGTGEEEKLLKNAKTEYSDEAEEIATYSAIETLANSVGDKKTAQVARTIRRQEERMASFLGRLIPTLTKAVAQAEIPAAERNGGRRRSASRTSASSRARTTVGRRTKSRAGTSRRRTTSGSRSGRATGRARTSRARTPSARSSSSSGSSRASSRRTTARSRRS